MIDFKVYFPSCIFSPDWYLLSDLLLMPFRFLRWDDGHLLPDLGLELPQTSGT